MALLSTEGRTSGPTARLSGPPTATGRLSAAPEASPFADVAREEIPHPRAARAEPANDMYGLCSVEDFPGDITDLTSTHEDARGFHDYVQQFVTPNFWLGDGAVLAWIYGEEFDNWQDFYGFDACTVVYHSGHGNMRADGTFEMPMGGTWGGTEWVTSAGMRLGNEIARYVFLSTCLSLRVHDGHNPVRTWDATNLGLRMLFGFETTSIDSPDYGRQFFAEWNKNKSLSQAWLDASWGIDTHQAPSVVACGSSEAEANDRLYNERLFARGSVPKNWWAWRWYDAAARLERREPELPESVRAVVFAPPDLSVRRLSDIADRFGIPLQEAPDLGPAPRRAVIRADGDQRLVTVDRDGSTEVRLAETDGSGRRAPGPGEAVRIASDAVEAFGLADSVDLQASQVRHEYTAGGSGEGVSEPRLRETVVVFTQVVDGQPVVSPGVGEVRVAVDSTRQVTRVVDATLPVVDVRDRPTFVGPPLDPRREARSPAPSTVDEALDASVQRLLRRLAKPGRMPTSVEAVPDSTEVGYAARGRDGLLVARRVVEVDCGRGLRKRFALEAPIYG